MARLPFDPDRVAPPAPTVPARRARGGEPLTISALSRLVKEAIAQGVPAKVRVIGEVSNLSDRTHWFFSLKDENACIRCVCFASAARKVDFPVRDGMQVIANGRLDYYDAQGQLQLYVDRLEPVGQGALELRFRALCEELRGLGYFDPQRKKPLPYMAQRVAVVTSRSAAALQDVIHTAARRWSGCELLLLDVRVQGEQAAPEIAAALQALSEHGPALGIDAIILTRGGGAMEDLWAFNERAVAEAVYRCRLPVVAAIGHETDTTIAELVADLRCATPTQAAMTVVPDQAALSQQVGQIERRLSLVLERRLQGETHRLEGLARLPIFRQPQRMLETLGQGLDDRQARLTAALPRRLATARQHLDHLAGRAFFTRPQRTLEPHAQRLDALAERLPVVMAQRIELRRGRLEALARQLHAVGPQQVLDRGYSYTLGPEGEVLRYPDQVRQGAAITTVLAGGKLHSVVADPETAARPGPKGPAGRERLEGDTSAIPAAPAGQGGTEVPGLPARSAAAAVGRAAPRRRRQPKPDGQPTLFDAEAGGTKER